MNTRNTFTRFPVMSTRFDEDTATIEVRTADGRIAFIMIERATREFVNSAEGRRGLRLDGLLPTEELAFALIVETSAGDLEMHLRAVPNPDRA